MTTEQFSRGSRIGRRDRGRGRKPPDRSGRTPRTLTPAHRSRRAAGPGLVPARSRRRPSPSGSAATGGGSGPHPQPAAWRPCRGEGRTRCRRSSDPRRQRDAGECAGEHDRRSRRHAAADCGRDHSRQGAHHRVRLFRRPAADAQSAQTRPYARRIERRSGGFGRGRHGAAQPRNPDRRFGEPPGGLLRHRRVQAQHGRLVELRARSICAELRHGRRVRSPGERCRRGGTRSDADISAPPFGVTLPALRSASSKTRSWRRRAGRSRDTLRHAADALARRNSCRAFASPVPFAEVVGWHKTVIEYEVAHAHPDLDSQLK